MLPHERAARWRSLARKRFTAEEDAVIIKLAPTHSQLRIAEILGRAQTSVQSACIRLGVTTNGGPGGWHAQRRNQTAQPDTEENA